MNPQDKQRPSTVNKTILLVEDEKPLLEVAKSRLEREGFSVLPVVSVDQALECMESGAKIDFIWLDHYLFGKRDGLDFVAKIKQTESIWKNLPIFVVSNTVSPSKVEQYLSLGVDKCYTKVDFSLDRIITDIKKILGC